MNNQNPNDIACILVVDDSADSLKFLTDVIEKTGDTVLVALAGQKALDVIDEVTPDVILMDAVMPGMDGFETCRRLKENSKMLHVPVIFMTGLSDTEHIVEGFQAGGVDYLVKPINPDELIARMQVHLANAKMAQSAYVAMDDARRYLLATDKRGTILWNTPQAARLIILLEPEEQTHVLRLPEYVRIWLGEQFDSEMATSAQLMLTDTVEHQILISYIGQSGKDEYLLRIIENNFATTQTRLSKNFGLTTREAEVLAWLATGKSNRDIGSILDLSPRTINKHLERIHSKLGVENRTAAAAMALNAM
ncbi:MAG: DNA-binding response regulator [Rhodospirillales bacterium]|jgi:DNA-binding response OmpR family regulator|nr:DNA-binding response regulator [Rhodospirillales bacterium]MBT5033867.1 DNA-binding response regulator [Rhodospirillaceae bacterium]MBT7487819.1 DNA-binding response regulator [Rhodospirillales bacterium]MBT8004921.1 DNA-binding response regulator [Rhodospirillales bacterium]